MRFATGTQAMNHVLGYAIEKVSTIYDWVSLRDATIVNVAGSRGQAAIELAKNFENIKLIVQDSANMIQGAESELPEDLKGRIELCHTRCLKRRRLKRMSIFFACPSMVWAINTLFMS